MFILDGSDGFSYYWYGLRREEEISSTRPQGGSSVMVWVSFGWTGKSSACFVNGWMSSNGYGEVLKNHLGNIGNGIDGSFKKIMLLFVGQKLILPGSNPKKSMFYLGQRYHLI